MSALNRKMARDLWASSGLLITISLIMSIGVTCFVSMNASHANLTIARDRYYQQCRMADFTIDLKKMPVSDLDPLRELPGVSEIRPRIQSLVTIDLEDEPRPLNGLVLSLPSDRQRVINDIVVTRGSYFTHQRDAEVLVNEAFAREHNLHPGGRIFLLLNNRRQELFIVGTAISSEFTYLVGPGGLVPDPEHFGVLYLKHEFMEEAFDYDGACNQIVGLLAPEFRERPEPILNDAERLLNQFGVFTAIPRADQSSHRFLDNELKQLGTLSILFPGIFLTVAATVLNVLLARLVDQQRTIVGTLKALGYSDLQVLLHYLQFGLVVGLVGGLLGCGLGYILANLMTQVYQAFFEFPELHNYFYPQLYGAGLAASLFCAALGALQGTRTVLRLEPAVAMRPKPPPQGGQVWLEKLTWFWSRLDTGWRMVLRNLLRNYTRTLVGLFAAAMGAGLMTNGLLINRALFHLIDFQFQKILRSDVDLTFKDERGVAALYECQHLPGVDLAEPQLQVACTFYFGHQMKRSGISGLLPNATLTVPRDTNGEPIPIPAVGLVMGNKLAEMLGVKQGDVVTVRPTKGDRIPRQVRIVQVADSYLGLACYADLHFLSRLVNEEFALSGVQLKVNPEPEIRAAFFRELKRLPALQSYSAREEVEQNLSDTLIKANGTAVGIIICFSGFMFFGSTLNSALIGLAERRREVATLLVLGYTSGAIGRLFWRESLVVNTIGTLLGLPLGVLLVNVVAAGFDSELARLPIVKPPIVWIIVLALGMLFNVLSHAVVLRQIYRLNWQDSLKVQE